MNPRFVSEEMKVIIIRPHPFRRLHKFFPTIWSHLTYLVFIAPPWFCKQLLFILLNKKFFTLLGQISCLQDNFRDWEREGSKTKNIVLSNHSAGCGLTKKGRILLVAAQQSHSIENQGQQWTNKQQRNKLSVCRRRLVKQLSQPVPHNPP